MRKSWLRMGLVIIILLGGCNPLAGDTQPGTGVTVRMAQATWETGWFQARVYKALLEELGYAVKEPETLNTVEFYFFLPGGDVDFWANGWFPLHQSYLEHEDVAGKIEAIGFQVKNGALQGYLVDKETADRLGITNLGDLRDPAVARVFDSDGNGRADLIGCDVGWACARVIEHQLDAFELRDTVDHVQGEYSKLMLDVLARYKAGEPILAYTWTPNWTLSELVVGQDVLWLPVPFSSSPDDTEPDTEVEIMPGCLETPCDMGFGPNDIRVVANVEFLAENAAATTLFELAEIPLQDIAAQNERQFAGESSNEDIRRHAEEWIDTNREQVDRWLAAARTAAE